MTANHRLRLIRVKIERADEHLHELEVAVANLGAINTYTVSAYLNPESGKPQAEFRRLNIYPARIAAIAGDVVHNLRSALDHLALQLVYAGIESGEIRTESF